MRVASEAFRIISRPDVEQAEEFPHSAEERRGAIGDEASGLVDLLSDIDGLKHEINERIRRLDAVKQAKAILAEDATRTEILNRRLAGLGLAPVATHPVSSAGDSELRNSDPVRLREAAAVTKIHHWADPESSRDFGEPANSSAVPWPRAEGTESHLGGIEAAVAIHEERAQGIRPEPRSAAAERAALEQAIQRLERSEQMCKEYEQNALAVKRSLDESAAQLSSAASKEQQATADLLAAQEALAATRESASARIDEAERCWKLVDSAAQMVKERVEQASKELTESVARHDAAAADLVTARQDLTTAYQFASVAAQRRLESREFFTKAWRWMIAVTAISWAIMGWLAWLSFRQFVPIWAPGVLTVLILVIASRIKTKEKEEA